ncbi:rhomboid domain-containing protein 3 [Osmerus mordax]|uniref:rhomboid domain-containing protein 3 n=1 Tax=Osmerus mordax TaxID=8014 RepID=UPI00350FB0D5
MLEPVLSLWFGSNQPGFFLGSTCLVSAMMLMWLGGIQASLSLGPGGEFPGFRDLSLYAVSHDELPSLLYNALLVLLLGPCQERRWGTFTLLVLSILSMVLLPPLYTLLLFIGGGEASRISGFSAVQLALFTAQCRQVKQRKMLRCIPVWFLPWLLLLFNLLLLPNTSPLLHFCAICIGHNYRQSFVAELQGVAMAKRFDILPEWIYIPSSSRLRLPTHGASHRSGSLPLLDPLGRVDLPRRPSVEDPPLLNPQPWAGPAPHWLLDGSASVSEAHHLDEQMLRAGILASLQGAPEAPDTKVEVPKSSVSSIRLQQLEKMGFPTEKAVLALAASKQLDGAISLLIDGRVGEEAVVTSKGKNFLPPHRT